MREDFQFATVDIVQEGPFVDGFGLPEEALPMLVVYNHAEQSFSTDEYWRRFGKEKGVGRKVRAQMRNSMLVFLEDYADGRLEKRPVDRGFFTSLMRKVTNPAKAWRWLKKGEFPQQCIYTTLAGMAAGLVWGAIRDRRKAAAEKAAKKAAKRAEKAERAKGGAGTKAD